MDDPRWEAALADIQGLCGRVLAATAATTGMTGGIDLLFTDDAEMRRLNLQWRNLDKPTDVLSFAGEGSDLPDGARHMGDVALGFETAMRDAARLQRPFEAHVSHLLVHGFLHLLGYDHIEPGDAARMEPLEAAILADLGWPDPYRTGPYQGGPDGDPD